MSHRISTIFITLLLLLQVAGVNAQNEEINKLHILAHLNVIASDGENAPYWLAARRQGLSSLDDINGYQRVGGLYCGKFGENGDFGYKIAADINFNKNYNSDVFMQQAYGELSWRAFALSIGSKERFSEQKGNINQFSSTAFGNNKINSLFPNIYKAQVVDMSSGGLIYSGNARPIPQVRIEIPEYTPFPGTKGWLHIKGHIAYGKQSDGDFQMKYARDYPSARYGENILFHSKAVFLKIGNPNRSSLVFEGGLELYSQFGGDIYTHGGGHVVSMPREFKDYIKAFIPLSGGDDTPLDEQTNISGNQLGSWHASFTMPTKFCDIQLYGEHLFEDFSQLFFFEYQNNKEGKKKIIYYPWKDILLGVKITNKSNFAPFISGILYEYMNTYDQSGALYHDPSENFNEQMDGVDNYYNHGIYPGWHHWGMGMGNPLIFSPLYNKNGNLEFRYNRVLAHNAGINGIISNNLPIAYRFQYTYSENWGTYLHPIKKKGYTTSILGEFIYAPKDKLWAASLSLGYDKSNIIGDNFGAMFSVARAFSLNLK